MGDDADRVSIDLSQYDCHLIQHDTFDDEFDKPLLKIKSVNDITEYGIICMLADKRSVALYRTIDLHRQHCDIKYNGHKISSDKWYCANTLCEDFTMDTSSRDNSIWADMYQTIGTNNMFWNKEVVILYPVDNWALP